MSSTSISVGVPTCATGIRELSWVKKQVIKGKKERLFSNRSASCAGSPGSSANRRIDWTEGCGGDNKHGEGWTSEAGTEGDVWEADGTRERGHMGFGE